MNMMMKSLVIVLLLASFLLQDSEQLSIHRGAKRRLSSAYYGRKDRRSSRPALSFTKDMSEDLLVKSVGSTIELRCSVIGNGDPTVYWLLNGSHVVQSKSELSVEMAEVDVKAPFEQTVIVASKLVIDCASPEDRGVYTCVGETEEERITKSTVLYIGEGSLEVENAEECKQNAVGVPARITLWTDDVMQQEGTDLVLKCRAAGVPAPKMRWFDTEESVIKAGSHHDIRVLKNGDLLIENLNFYRHMGIYTCEVENALGSDKVEIFVYPTALS